MRITPLFFRSRHGAVAPMIGVCISLLVLISGGAVEYSDFHRAKAALQKTADAAALSAARHRHETNDEDAARALAEQMLILGATAGYVLQTPAEISFEYEEEYNLTHASVRARAVGQTSFLRLAGVRSLTAEVEAFASRGGAKDVYIYFLLDVTTSMMALIQVAGVAMMDLEAQLRARLEQQGVEMGRLFVKVGFFRDLRHDPVVVSAWEESPVYDMSDPSQRADLRSHIMTRLPVGGFDFPESSPAAVAHALTAPIESPVAGARLSRHVLQVIAIWTDTHGLPLGPEDISAFSAAGGPPMAPAVDDITVSLHNALRRSGELPMLQASLGLRAEDAYYDDRDYGCCRSMAELRTEWRSRGTIPLNNRYLALFTPRDAYPWREMATWENVVPMGYIVASVDAFIDGIAQSVIDSGVELQITPPRRPIVK